jgi:hypothetical protein
MISFDVGTHIFRPLKQVFHFVTAPENDFQWQYGTLASTRLSAGMIGLGSIFRVVGHFLGERTEGVFEVTSFEPYKTYGYRSRSGPVLSTTLYSFAIHGGSTDLGLSVQINPGDPFKPGNTITEKRLKKQYKENLALLKNLLEAAPRDKAAPMRITGDQFQEPG